MMGKVWIFWHQEPIFQIDEPLLPVKQWGDYNKKHAKLSEVSVVDEEGFRPNVGIVLADDDGKLLWARRLGSQDAWQFPQGGIKNDEAPELALYREMDEEIGLRADDVEIVGVTRGWLRYRLPKRLIRDQEPRCIGQKQKWFLLHLRSDKSRLQLDKCGTPEFDGLAWVSYWYPMGQVVSFKRDVYRRALKELVPAYNRLFARRIVA
jgi:putative (di)nucleoside polyphosphate hydrolase